MLIQINLLDWRAELREKRKQQFITATVAAAVAACGLVGLAWLYMNNAIDNQNERNRMLRDEIVLIEKQIKEIEELERTRANLLARMRVIERLQQSRAQIVHYFDEIVNTIPEGIVLTQVSQQSKTTTIEGVADSNGRVSAYMKNLDASPWFKDPLLVVIKTSETRGDTRRLGKFNLKVTEVNPSAQQSSQEEGGQ